MAASSMSPDYRQRLGYQAILLGIAVLVTSAILIFVHIQTRDEIAQRLEEDLQASLTQVIPPKMYDSQILKDTVIIQDTDVTGKAHDILFYRARKQGELVALAFPATGYGYSGEIRMIIGIDTRGNLLGVRIISHAETPGLGDKIEVGKDKWILGFNGLSLENPAREKWQVKKDGGVFDSFTGATITPRAVVTAVRHGLEAYERHQDELKQAPPANSGGNHDGT